MQPFKPDRILTFKTNSAEPLPLLEFLYSVLPDRSKTSVKSLLRHRQIKVGQTVTTQFNFSVNPEDTVLVNLTREWPSLNNPRLKIVYEDDHIVVVNKGYGLLSVGTETKKEGTAYSILRDYVKRVDPRQKIFVVHRLDSQTSGLMMFAKTVEAKEAMQHNWNNMVLDRRYIAVVEGVPAEAKGEVRNYLSENSQHVVYSTPEPVEGGRLAVTRWRRLRSRGGYSLMELSLDTGRKNQIRVHMKDLGHPIAGDRKYGAATSPLHRMALHAATLRFVHPVTRKDMKFSTPVPDGFNRLV